MKAWERRHAETSKQYEAFCSYRDMGPSRSLHRVAQELSKSVQLLKRWSAANGWVERARALDDRDEEIRLEAVEMHESRRANETASRIGAIHEKSLANEQKAAEITGRVLSHLAEMPLVRSRATQADEEGRPVEYVVEPTIKNLDLTAARLHKIATRSMPAQIDDVDYDLDNATEDQLRRIAAGEDPGKVLLGG